jgi:hypothetical protein
MEKQKSRHSQLLLSALLVGAAIFMGDIRAAAASGYRFAMDCGEIKADEISEELNVFVRRSEYFSPLYKVFKNSDGTKIAISGFRKNCLLVASTKNSAWRASETFVPVTGRTEYMAVRSRKKAEARFWAEVEDCSKNSEKFLRESYYRDNFLRDYPISNSYETPNVCYEILSYASQSLILEHGGGAIVVDIVVGEIFIGEID